MAGKQVRSDVSGDRISNLPCNVIDCILTRLPLKDAVRTSILSTQWRHKWLTIPHLNFEEPCNHGYIVFLVLLRHKGAITKFSYKQASYDSGRLYIVDGWVHLLSNHSHIEDFTLLLSSHTTYVIPQSLFTFEHLRHLHLHGGTIKLPSKFTGFNKLVTLTLERIVNTFDELKTCISKCPMLEVLNVLFVDDKGKLACLDIIAPKLETFHFCGSLGSLNLNVPSIKNVTLEIHNGYKPMGTNSLHNNFELSKSLGSKSNMVKVFSQMPSVEHVKLGTSGHLQFLATGGVPQKLPDKLNHLMRLDIDVNSFGHKKYVRIFICLIVSSPNLRWLRIKSNTKKSMPEAIQFLKDQQECKAQLCHLKSVEICSILNQKADMEFVKLLLLWASALEKLEVNLSEVHCYDSQRINILENLASFRRSSSDAVIIFK